MGKSFRDTLKERMRDPAFLAEWNVQKQCTEITGIDQADISRLENGTANPSLKTLKRLAAGMGKQLKLEFVPISDRTQVG